MLGSLAEIHIVSVIHSQYGNIERRLNRIYKLNRFYNVGYYQ
jgi:hypothetical protein